MNSFVGIRKLAHAERPRAPGGARGRRAGATGASPLDEDYALIARWL